MPTKPLNLLLDREVDKEQSKPIIDIASPVLQEVVNYATTVYERCRTSKKGGKGEAFPVLASYLHMIQMTDSIEVLISNSCGPPAFLLLRSSFEAKLGIEYIIEKKSEKRALAWMVKNIVEQIEEFQKYDPSQQKGKEFRKLYDEDRLNYTDEQQFLSETRATLGLMQNLLKQPVYSDVYSEYKRLLKKRGRPPEWYAFFDGPSSIRGLALYLKQPIAYETLYRSWSRITHAGDFSHLSLPLKDGTNILGPIRNPLVVVHTAATAISFLLEATELLLKEYRTGEMDSYRNWLMKEVDHKHNELIQLEKSQLNWFYRSFVKDKFAEPNQPN